MIVEHVSIRGFGPIQKFDEDFVRTNVVIGLNGCGKTTLLSFLAGVAGNDEATGLIAQQAVESCYIRLKHEDRHFEFQTFARFDLEKIDEFKNSLPKRINFALTEWGRTFAAHCVDLATAREEFRVYMTTHGSSANSFSPMRLFVYHPSARSARFLSGDGDKFAMSLFLNDSEAGVPSLYDSPDRHMDLSGKRLMAEMLNREDRQIIYTTHNPEMIPAMALKGYASDEKIIDMSQT